MKKCDKALIFINGDEDNLDYAKKYLTSRTLIIGCDGGTDKIYDLGLKPDVVIGDFDSIKSVPNKIKSLPADNYGKQILIDGISYIKYPEDKDFLDSELAIDYAVNQNVEEIILVNTQGEEIDHVLGVLLLLIKRKYRELKIKIIRPNQTIYLARNKFDITGRKGNKISLIPMYGSVKVTSSSGLKYDPSQYKMSLHNNLGISNELTSKKATLDIKKGCFLVVHHHV